MKIASVLLVLLLSYSSHAEIRVKSPAPAFEGDAVMPDQSFKTVSLSSLTKDNQWLLLNFYPADFTFVCPTEILAFNDAHAEFKARNVNLVFASVDNKHTHLAWLRTARKDGGLGKVEFPLIGDVTKEISEAYGVVIPEGDDKGQDLRGSFLIDPQGILRHYSINDLPVGRSVDEALRLIDGFQFAANNPDLGCPANWKKGDLNIKTDPVGSREYFSEVHKDL